MHTRSLWTHMRRGNGSIHTLREILISVLSNEVALLASDPFIYMTGQVINETGKQEIL